MALISIALKVALGLLMVISIIELGLVSSTVGWLHQTASKGFIFRYGGSTHQLGGTPSDFLVNQGHTSNGAAGTAFVLIGIGGVITLWVRGNTNYRTKSFSIYVYYLWLAFQIPALLLTTSALGYVFYVTNAREGQTIDVPLAVNLHGSPYPVGSWTPQNWFAAVLRLDLVDGRNDILTQLYIMRGWQYNLIPFFLTQLLETALAFLDFSKWRRAGGKMSGHSQV
ncbi:hypothetical protein JX265_013576 [Neoarthrinium moseri]|uniref:Uncharacterized protein n=1 Tax=Neoarthrinium moseri TaxID=1658444 RepID=A0A9Q0AFS8_9PEZI|nr:hypothetical protein JX265_013576 [Neoarthrinium moseri]